MILENPRGEVQLFVSEENSLITLSKDIVGLIQIPAATHTTGVDKRLVEPILRFLPGFAHAQRVLSVACFHGGVGRSSAEFSLPSLPSVLCMN